MTAPHSTAFSTCDFCDAHKADDSGAFRVLPPVFQSYGGVAAFAGAVATVKCFEDNTLVKAAVDSPGLGRVLVVDGGGSLRRALVGGNLAAAAARNGWAGVVVDGCVRDVAELNAAAVGIRALGLMMTMRAQAAMSVASCWTPVPMVPQISHVSSNCGCARTVMTAVDPEPARSQAGHHTKNTEGTGNRAPTPPSRAASGRDACQRSLTAWAGHHNWRTGMIQEKIATPVERRSTR